MSSWHREQGATKYCRRCETVKPITDFKPRANRGPHAVQPTCRACIQETERKQRQDDPEFYRAKARRLYRENADKIKERSAAWKRANRDKARAHSAVEYALETGKLKRPSRCENCGYPRDVIHAHHEDYSKPLEVEWLCSPCHKAIHLEEAA